MNIPFLDNNIPWVPLRAGLHMRPLHFEPHGYALQLRLEPGTVIGKHRHTGELHALNLSGAREILETGEIVNEGDYVYEPAGTVDSWRCHGNKACIVHISLVGRVEYLDDNNNLLSYSDSGTAKEAYISWCDAQGLKPDPTIVSDRAA
jgi:2,4'-dihydroxyacetophenone dioxygenase